MDQNRKWKRDKYQSQNFRSVNREDDEDCSQVNFKESVEINNNYQSTNSCQQTIDDNQKHQIQQNQSSLELTSNYFTRETEQQIVHQKSQNFYENMNDSNYIERPKFYEENKNNYSNQEIHDLSQLSVNCSNIDWINALNSSATQQQQEFNSQFTNKNYSSNLNSKVSQISQQKLPVDIPSSKNKQAKVHIINNLYKKRQYDSLETNANTLNNSLENTHRQSNNNSKSRFLITDSNPSLFNKEYKNQNFQQYDDKQNIQQRIDQIVFSKNNENINIMNGIGEKYNIVRNYKEQIDDTLHDLSLERQRQSYDIERIKAEINQIKQNKNLNQNTQPIKYRENQLQRTQNPQIFVQNVDEGFSTQNQFISQMKNEQDIRTSNSQSDFESINYPENQYERKDRSQDIEKDRKREKKNQSYTEDYQGDIVYAIPKNAQLEIDQLRKKLQLELKQLNHEKQAYLKEKQHFQKACQGQATEAWIQDFSNIKQELFEIRVRMDFLEKEKTKMLMELDQKDESIKRQIEENIKLQKRINQQENREIEDKETTAKYMEQQIQVSSQLSKILRKYFLDYEQHDQNTPIVQKLEILEAHIQGIVEMPQIKRQQISMSNQNSSTHLIPRYQESRKSLNQTSKSTFQRQTHSTSQDHPHDSSSISYDQNDENYNDQNTFINIKSVNPSQSMKRVKTPASRDKSQKKKQVKNVGDCEFKAIMRKIDDLENVIVNNKPYLIRNKTTNQERQRSKESTANKIRQQMSSANSTKRRNDDRPNLSAYRY